jgi:hypothetical protein
MLDEMTAGTAESAPPLTPEDTTPAKPQGEISVEGEIPPRPALDPSVMAFTKALWDETRNLPAFDEAVKSAREAQATLFPAWHDRGDKWRGKVPIEKRTRKEDRLVRTPHIYLNQRQAIAQTVPEDHAAIWQPREQVKPRDSTEIAASGPEEQWADTVRIAVTEYLGEARVQEWLEAFVADAKSFPLAVIKITFQRDWESDALNGPSSSGDEEDSTARLRMLAEEYARGNLQKDDPRYLEMHQLASTLGGKTEMQLWRRIRLSTVPINAFRAPDSCKNPLTIYDQPWLADDMEMTPEEIRTKYAFKPDADGKTWKGVHPEDLEVASGKTDGAGYGRTAGNSNLKRRSTRRGGNTRGSEDVKRTLVVSEVWHRISNTVYTLVEGIPYPVAKWIPDRQPERWFPYIVVVPNPIPNDLYGISDVELQADIQHRINRKGTDEEKARWLGLPRDFFDNSIQDEKKIGTAISEAKPGKATGLPLAGRSITEVLQRLSYDVKPDAFDATRDKQDLRLAGRMSEQRQGVTGTAKFAAEVQEAAAGTELATSFDQNIYKRVLEDLYDRTAQILIFELDEDDWYDVAGPHALVPQIGTEAEVREAKAGIRKDAMQEASKQIIQSLGQDPELMTPWGQPDPLAMKRKAREIAANIEEQLTTNRYGPNGLISREGLYRRLRVKVVLSLNGSIDKKQRMQAMRTMMEGLLFAAQAAKEAGMRFDPKPWLRRWAQLTGEQTALDAMFDDNPDSVAGALVQLLAKGSQLDPQTLAMLGQVLGPLMAQQAAVAEQGGGAVPGAAPAPEPAPPGGEPAGAAA